MWWECVHGGDRVGGSPELAGRAAGTWGPGKRWGHTCNAVKGGSQIYVFGGYGGDNRPTNDVHVFDTVSKTWSKPLMRGAPPSPRDSHSCTTVGNRLFVFGGTDGTKPLKDVHVLDTLTNIWIVPAVTGEGPASREGHSATLVEKRIFIFGGCGKSRDTHEEFFNDLYILDTEYLVWERVMTSGIPPSPRDSHTCTSWNKKIVVLGGEDSSDCYLSDVYILDTDTLVWKQLKTLADMFTPRAGHTSVAIGHSLFVFGGFSDEICLCDDILVLNLYTRTWRKVVPLNRGPSARFSVAGDCLDGRRGIIVFIGGCNKYLEGLDDMYYLHAEQNGRAEPKLEKSSLRRVLNKCRENNHRAKEPAKTNDVRMFGMESNSSRFVNLMQAGNQAGDPGCSSKVLFLAKLTGQNQHGFILDTIIDGKKLHGILFSDTAIPSQDGHTYPNKKRMRRNRNSSRTTRNELQPLLPQENRISSQEQNVATCANELASAMEIDGTNLNGLTTNAGLYQPNTASENVVPLFLQYRDLNYGLEKMEPPKAAPLDIIKESQKLNLSLKPAKDLLKTEAENQCLKSGSENLKLKVEEISIEPRKSGEEIHCQPVGSSDEKHRLDFSQVKDQEKMVLDKPKGQ